MNGGTLFTLDHVDGSWPVNFPPEYHFGPNIMVRRNPPIGLVRLCLVMKMSSVGSLDREVALARVGGDPELLKEIAVLFLDNYPTWVGELREAGAKGNADAVERTAHGLKGSVANFGARDAVEASLKLETLGRSRDLAGLPESLAALEAALETLRGDLESL